MEIFFDMLEGRISVSPNSLDRVLRLVGFILVWEFVELS